MRRLLVAISLVALSSVSALAHPGWGIVRDNRGNVFFTDTTQVLKISPDGLVSVAVRDVHTHELCLDAGGNLLGEHLWYEGDATGKWRHRVWRARPDGSVSDIIPAREGFRTDYSFVQDRAGNMYWADAAKPVTIKKRSPAGAITTHARGDFRSIERMTATPDGTLYLMDAGAVRRVSPNGVVSTVVRGLTGTGRPAAEVAELNHHMGIWTDGTGRIYIAAARERLILRVTAAGQVETVARSAAPWSPSGGLVDSDGSLWILEYDTANASRVRRVDRTGQERIFIVPARSSGQSSSRS